MKKITCLILTLVLALGCVLALASCDGGEQKDRLQLLIDMANNSNATKIVTFVEYDNSKDELGAKYTTEIEGNDMIFSYEKERYNTVSEGILNGEGLIVTEKGTVYYVDGQYYGEDGLAYADTPSDVKYTFNITKENLTGAKLAGNNGFTAELTKEQAVAVFGTDLSAEGNIALEVVTTGLQLTGVKLTYTTVSGATVVVNTSYSYNAINLDFSPIFSEMN